MAKILVIDDDAQMRRVLDKGFSRQGHIVVPVPELAQALIRIEREAFDLVILDLEMRGEHGITFLESIRKAKCDVPIVIYSGAVTIEMEQALRRAGANEVIGKETDIKKLIQQVEKVLEAGGRLFTEPKEEKTLLIVDDDDSIRNFLNTFFSRKNYKVLEAEDGEKAVSIAKSENISCVLLDVNMPGMSGLIVIPKLLEINPDIGIVMISGEGDEEVIKKAIDMGAYGYIMKPFDLVYLELTVASRLTIASSN